jgi:hypothetical protein
VVLSEVEERLHQSKECMRGMRTGSGFKKIASRDSPVGRSIVSTLEL